MKCGKLKRLLRSQATTYLLAGLVLVAAVLLLSSCRSKPKQSAPAAQRKFDPVDLESETQIAQNQPPISAEDEGSFKEPSTSELGTEPPQIPKPTPKPKPVELPKPPPPVPTPVIQPEKPKPLPTQPVPPTPEPKPKPKPMPPPAPAPTPTPAPQPIPASIPSSVDQAAEKAWREAADLQKQKNMPAAIQKLETISKPATISEAENYYIPARFKLGVIYQDEKKDWPKAAAYYEEILQMVPAQPVVSSNLGYCYFKMGKFNDALKEYQKVEQYQSRLKTEDREDIMHNMRYYRACCNRGLFISAKESDEKEKYRLLALGGFESYLDIYRSVDKYKSYVDNAKKFYENLVE